MTEESEAVWISDRFREACALALSDIGEGGAPVAAFAARVGMRFYALVLERLGHDVAAHLATMTASEGRQAAGTVVVEIAPELRAILDIADVTRPRLRVLNGGLGEPG